MKATRRRRTSASPTEALGLERAHLRALQKSIREPPLTADKLPIDEVRRAAAAPQKRSLQWDKCERRFRVDSGPTRHSKAAIRCRQDMLRYERPPIPTCKLPILNPKTQRHRAPGRPARPPRPHSLNPSPSHHPSPPPPPYQAQTASP